MSRVSPTVVRGARPAARNRECYGGAVTASLVHSGVDVALRPWELADAEELAVMYAAAAAELTADAPWRTPEWFTVAGQRERIRRCLDVDAVEGFVITASGAIVGNLTLDEIRRDILQSADIGYWVAPGARRSGVATHAIGLAVGHAFGCLGLHRIHATVDIGKSRLLAGTREQRLSAGGDPPRVRDGRRAVAGPPPLPAHRGGLAGSAARLGSPPGGHPAPHRWLRTEKS